MEGKFMESNEMNTGNVSELSLEEQKKIAYEERRKIRKQQESLFTGTIVNRSSHSSSRHGSGKKRHHHHHHSSSKKRRKKRIIIISIVLVVALILGAIGTFIYLYFTGKSTLSDSQSFSSAFPEDMDVVVYGDSLLYNGSRYSVNKDVVNILFMETDKVDLDSSDSDSYTLNEKTEMLFLVSIDGSNNKITLFNVPNTIMTDIKIYSQLGGEVGSSTLPLSLAYTYSDSKEAGCYNTTEAVSRIFFNVPLTTYYAIEKNGLVMLNDYLGGVRVVSPESVNGFEKGRSYELDGEKLLSFIEDNGKTIESAYAKYRCQEEFFTSEVEQLLNETAGNVLYPVNTNKKVSSFTSSNFDIAKTTYLETLFYNHSYTVECKEVPVDLKEVDGEIQGTVREKELFDIFLDTFYIKAE